MNINESAENYLESILVLSKRLPVVRSVDIAVEMNFKKSSISVAMKNLRENGFITVSDAGFITLTDKGHEIADMIYERHTFLSEWLMALGICEETAVEDACRMEHIVSEETVRQVCNFVNYGETFERVLRYTDLSYRYAPGDYVFLMGIYYMEKTYPRRFAREFQEVPRNCTTGFWVPSCTRSIWTAS